jgi:hypothetical protein
MKKPLLYFLLMIATLTTALGVGACDNDDDELCSNSCEYARDGDCDDGGQGSDYDLCRLGTDCEDCGIRQ